MNILCIKIIIFSVRKNNENIFEKTIDNHGRQATITAKIPQEGRNL